MPKKLSTGDFDIILNAITIDLMNGNRTDALDRIKELNPLQAGYAAVMVSESELVSDANKRWLMNAMYNG